MRTYILFAVIFCTMLLACNKEELNLSQEEVLNHEAKLEDGLPPIINYSRTCLPNEIIENEDGISGYTDKQSYSPGEIVEFYNHSLYPDYSLTLYRFGEQQEMVLSLNQTDGMIQNYSCYSYSYGCDWDVSVELTLPDNLISGIYSAELKNKSQAFWVTFVVREKIKNADIAVIASTNTWCAYNNWGGGSFYSNLIQEETHQSENISFLRPNKSGNPLKEGHLAGSELHLLKWLENKSIKYNMFADIDLHSTPGELSKYKIIIAQTHPEYYSVEMFNAIRGFINAGGRLMYLGGNGFYAKVVYDPIRNILETRKTGSKHYYDNSSGGLYRHLGLPESKLVGIQYDRLGYDTYYPYAVKDENHWIFNNTNLKTGDEFGASCGRGGASGHETDKITASSPSNLILLAKGSNPDNGGGDLIYFENNSGGKVFSVGSVTYTSCINSDPIISQITENVINEFIK